MSNINEFPIDTDLKHTITNLVASYIQRAGLEWGEESKKWFFDNCSEELIENILDGITEWEKQKLN
jgi:hypothetical protein